LQSISATATIIVAIHKTPEYYQRNLNFTTKNKLKIVIDYS